MAELLSSFESNDQELKNTELSVSEIFHSLQGEGYLAGVPSVFLRLAYCNLQCTWCDTKYTWDWVNHDPRKEIKRLRLDQVVEEIAKHPGDHIVVTGGEPLLQKRDLLPLLRHLRSSGYSIEVETAGTLPPGRLLEFINVWNVSPKLENSENPRSKREIPEVLSLFSQMQNAYFKFVLADRSDIDEVIALVRKYRVPKSRVFLMPEACDRETLERRSPWVSEMCERNGFRFSSRLQIELWNGLRGC